MALPHVGQLQRITTDEDDGAVTSAFASISQAILPQSTQDPLKRCLTPKQPQMFVMGGYCCCCCDFERGAMAAYDDTAISDIVDGASRSLFVLAFIEENDHSHEILWPRNKKKPKKSSSRVSV